ncbi:hypothetical protein BDZ45DRAFT_687477 [Acephala macrosclerotiorum]|nr:hypothetical protein BDZ45DRAFT_687477 [Acephala macrosclerotiorum]
MECTQKKNIVGASLGTLDARRVPSRPTLTTKSDNARMLKLPTELWANVLMYLNVGDIQSVRLACKALADMASRYLFQTFIFRPDRKDIERFSIVSDCARFATGIKILRFKTDIIPIDYMQYNLSLAYLHAFNGRQWDEPLPANRISSEELESQKEEAIKEYALWNDRWHRAKQDYRSVALMKMILDEVKSLEQIDVSTKNRLNLEAWLQGTETEFSKRVNTEFKTLLLALRSSSLVIKSLSHDGLPVSFFVHEEQVLKKLTFPLRHLISLRLTFDASEAPHAKFWHLLGQFLTSIPNLESLRFGFAPLLVGVPDAATWGHSAEHVKDVWYAPLWRLLGSHTWQRLRKLRLDGLLLCEGGLMDLLARHQITLEQLEPNNVGLWSGSFQSLLTGMKNTLTLKNLSIWGFARAMHSARDHWILFKPLDLSAETWSDPLKSCVIRAWDDLADIGKRMDIATPLDIADRLESFVLYKSPSPWPLSPTETLMPVLDPSAHSELCENCYLSITDVDADWDDLNVPLGDWQDFNTHDAPGFREDEIEDFYLANGFDEDGFDRNGFDMNGVHFDTIHEDYQGVAHPMSEAKARRTILEGLLQEIPRYAALHQI